MSTPDLRTAIAVVCGQVATSGAALGSASITTLLTTYWGQDALTIADAEITNQPDDACVVVHGSVALLCVTVTGDFRFFVDGGVAQLELTVTPPAGWTLGKSFASLKGDYFDTFALGAPRLSLRSQQVGAGASGLTLDAGFMLPESLEALRWFLKPDSVATLSGPIAFDHALPVMNLSVSPTMKASLGGYVDIDLTMRHLAMVQQGDPAKPPVGVTVSRLDGNLSFSHAGKAVAVPLQVGFNDQTGLLLLKLVTGNIFDLALGEIAHWIGGTDLSKAALPSQYSPQSGLTLHDVEFAIGLRTQSLEYVKLTIASASPWQLIDKLTLTIDALTFMISPKAAQPLATAITGTLSLGNTVSLEIHACYPDFTISGHLAGDSVIDLIPVLTYLGAPAVGVPSALQINLLDFSAQPSGSNYSFTIEVAGTWQIVKALVVDDLKASAAYRNKSLELRFAGRFFVGGVDLNISADYDSEAGGWLFAGRAAQDKPLQIGAFVTQLTSDFSSTAVQMVPDFIASLEIAAIAITFDTVTMDFDFRCETRFEVEGNGLDLTLHISLRNDGNDSYTHLFGGVMVIGSLVCELVFEDVKKGATSSSTLLAAVQPCSGIDVRALVSEISADAGALMPQLTLTLEDVLFLYRKSGTAPATWLFGLAIGLDLNLQSLPLIGPVLRDAGVGGIKDIQALYTSAAVSADDIAAFNILLGEAGAKQTLPVKKGATGTNPVLTPGFNFAANLDMGSAPVALTAGGTSAPPNVPAPAAGTVAKPPAGNASWFDVHKSIGPVTLDRVGVRYERGRAWLLVDADFMMAGLTLGLQGLALGTKLDDPSAIAVNLDGMSVNLASGPLTIAGGFLHLGDDYIGQAQVQAVSFGLTAIGGYAPGDDSFFIFVRLNAPLGGPPFFFITGIAGGFGINRTLTIPSVENLASFALLPANNSFPTQLGTGNPGATLASTLASTESYIRPQAGMNWAAAGLDFTSFEMVASSALVTVSFGVDFSLALLGVTRLTVPKGDPEPIVYLEIMLEAQLKPSSGLLAVDGRLTPASFLFAQLCRITGGFAFYLWFDGEHSGDFVISIGGYHPRFAKPDHYPVVPRLLLSYQIGDLVITGQSYLALTPHMVMAGMRIDATWKCGALNAWFSADIDFLLGWKPFHYEADAYVHIGVSLTIDLLFTSVSITIHVGVDLDIWGPQFGGNASIDLDIVSFTISFGDAARLDAVDWAGFTTAFLPAGKTSVSAPAHLMATAAPASEQQLDHGSLWCTGSVAVGLVRDLKAADTTSFFAWLVDANHFTLQAGSLIPAKSARFNSFDLHAPFTVTGGFTPASTGDTPTAQYDQNAWPGGVIWTSDFGVLPMQLAPANFQTHIDVQLLRPKPGTDHTDPANYVDAVDAISVMPQVRTVSSALWAGADPGLNGERLIAQALVGMSLSPMAQHPDITFKADLWAMLFDQGQPIVWKPTVPAADRTDSYAAVTDGGTLSFTVTGQLVRCGDYLLSALTTATAAQTRSATVAGLAALGLALDHTTIDVAGLAAYPLWDWPMIRTLGEECSA